MWNSTNETNDVAMECLSIPETTRHTSAISFRLNMDADNSSPTINDMVIDELSLYDDDDAVEPTRSFVSSPQTVNMLSPENSPIRFEVVVGKSNPDSNNVKFFPRMTCQQLLEVSNNTSANVNTPPKNFRFFNSLSSGSMGSSIDDDFHDLLELESLEAQQNSSSNLNFPSDLNSLISGQIRDASPVAPTSFTPEIRRPPVRRCLSLTENYQHQSPKTPVLLKTVREANIAAKDANQNGGFKRPDPPSTSNSPVQYKRQRSEGKENCVEPNGAVACPTRNLLRKSMSMNDAEIMSALTRSESKDEPDLIGDFSKPFALPIMEGRHRDLKSISSDTVARLLNGEFADQVASFKIIDCRYPYEFEGGHIRGAQNLYTQEQILEEFLNLQKTELQQAADAVAGNKRNIIIFHCEFSSERGPKLSRFLRNNDRATNQNTYPSLSYPEIYLLHNGYKEFYETHAELCEPNAYTPMLEPSFNEAYRHFRAKSKSWNGGGLGGSVSRLKKSRSRLML